MNKVMTENKHTRSLVTYQRGHGFVKKPTGDICSLLQSNDVSCTTSKKYGCVGCNRNRMSLLSKVSTTLGCDRNQMSILSKAINNVQNIFCLYDVTGLTQLLHLIPVATKCIIHNIFDVYDVTDFTQLWHSIPVATKWNCFKRTTCSLPPK